MQTQEDIWDKAIQKVDTVKPQYNNSAFIIIFELLKSNHAKIPCYIFIFTNLPDS